jgi:hypothetical protein
VIRNEVRNLFLLADREPCRSYAPASAGRRNGKLIGCGSWLEARSLTLNGSQLSSTYNGRAMRIPLWLKIGWTVWVLFWMPIYWKQYGVQNFLFFCDLGNLVIAVALWAESALLFSWQGVSLLVFQSVFTIDVAVAWTSGRHPIGGTEFMFDSHLPLLVRVLSLFHVVTPMLLLWAIWRLGYDSRGWKLQTLTCWLVVPINYFWRPEHNVNWARGIFFVQQKTVPGWLYLLAYLVLVPVVVYYPTHLLLGWWSGRGRARFCVDREIVGVNDGGQGSKGKAGLSG